MLRNRGQIEIMGLLLIIVLFAVGVLVALYFVVTPSDTAGISKVQQSVLASNALTTLRKTTTDCVGRNVEELLHDCARTGGVITCPGGGNTCQKADAVMDEVLTLLFDDLQKDYSFKIRNVPYFADTSYGLPDCPRDRESEEEPIPVGGFDIFVQLDICR